MRLLPTEHKDIMNLLKEAGLDNEILLTKKTGWVHLKHKGGVFSFHRKKVTSLESGKFIDSLEYYVGMPRKPEKVENWLEVAEQLKAWLEK
ncbi:MULTISPECIES: hypothetical protein [unclassified Imperialibacter]|uniref:hypothetical protein n=1 Tax=unclassified Imperialibacter TaxID=2629706 RepID=UPI0012550459|nr:MULTISPECIES: hypothetical protein [unclassified Imperialibacter]CAD5254427.1 hypothetical protein IMPERIA89_200036 [Imperialibacter sp. 89]CAD5267330.1 hypothetical protein IMPERIA75_340036 [Imperialibacter sp. 75]VVT00882.1 hypothetical protein IMPR6_110036 [Imperialibacter sp. EC-SDR9]